MPGNDPILNDKFKDYKCENKFHPNGSKSCITVLEKNPTLTYTRLTELEDEEMAGIWLKLEQAPESMSMFYVCIDNGMF